jgi:hypothetical protein
VLAIWTRCPIYWLFCLTIALAGFFVIPDTAVCLAFAGEVTYPAEQTMVNGIISLLGHGVAGILAIPASAIALKSPEGAIFFLLGLSVLGAIPMFFVTEDLRRSKNEEMRKSILEEGLLEEDQIDGDNAKN